MAWCLARGLAWPNAVTVGMIPCVEARRGPASLGELRSARYRPRPVREEMQRSLLAKLGAGEPILAGMVGADDTVVPEIENAVLAG